MSLKKIRGDQFIVMLCSKNIWNLRTYFIYILQLVQLIIFLAQSDTSFQFTNISTYDFDKPFIWSSLFQPALKKLLLVVDEISSHSSTPNSSHQPHHHQQHHSFRHPHLAPPTSSAKDAPPPNKQRQSNASQQASNNNVTASASIEES